MPSSKNILAEIVAHKHDELAERKTSRPLSFFERNCRKALGRFAQVLRGDDLKLVCEIKPASPSAGVLRSTVDVDQVVGVYDNFASAISCLTDKKYFSGSVELLEQVVHKSKLPVLCKDFIVDPYQIYEARMVAAEAVLLIVKILDDRQLLSLYKHTVDLGMTAVVEIQNESELERALALSPEVILINNRNLDTLQIDLATTSLLAPRVPDAIITVSASGIESRKDIEILLAHCNRFLIGSVLMASGNVEAKLKELAGK